MSDTKCKNCSGTGKVEVTYNRTECPIRRLVTCRYCNGTGKAKA